MDIENGGNWSRIKGTLQGGEESKAPVVLNSKLSKRIDGKGDDLENFEKGKMVMGKSARSRRGRAASHGRDWK